MLFFWTKKYNIFHNKIEQQKLFSASCDTEDRSNGCWKIWFAITGKMNFKIYYLF